MLNVPAWIQITALVLAVLGWIGDKIHAGIVRQADHRRAMADQVRDLTTVAETECGQRRAQLLADLDAKCESCQKHVDNRLAAGDDSFEWWGAATTLLAKNAGITSQQIQEEIDLRRRARGANHA